MRTVILFTILLSCMVAWGADNSDQTARRFLFELRLDLNSGHMTPQLMNTLSLSGSTTYLQREAMKLELFRQFTAQLFKADMKKAIMKKQMIDSIARSGKEDESDDSAYQGGDESGSGEETPAGVDARAAAKQENQRTLMMGGVVNKDQPGDAIDDSSYQGGGDAASGGDDPLTEITKAAKKEKGRADMRDRVSDGGMWSDTLDDSNYQPTGGAQGGANGAYRSVNPAIRMMPQDLLREIQKARIMGRTTLPDDPYRDRN
ncbi:MAG TPA: hypothetical protein PLV42_12390 [bacterium]|nr:hypothetical protein [bacterium]